MLIIRPVAHKDASAIDAFAQTAHAGLTSLPRDRELLKQKIQHSLDSFSAEIERPKDESYFFVLEDPEARTVAGTSAIYSKTGIDEPLYFWRILKKNRESRHLGSKWEETLLAPIAYRHGPTEIGTLYLFPDYRKGGWGRLLSLSRFLFMACFPERVERTVIAQMRGFIDAHGASPFWDKLGRQFAGIDFVQAMQNLERKGKGWVPEFLPEHPLYLDLLHSEVQNCVRRPHQNTRPALRMLEKEGFSSTTDIDIFDGGPCMTADFADIRVVKEHEHVEVGEILDGPVHSPRYVISNTSLSSFRAGYGHVNPIGDRVVIEKRVADALQVDIGSSIRYVSAVPQHESQAVAAEETRSEA